MTGKHEEKEKIKPKPNFYYCENIFIIDDATSFLRNKKYEAWLIRLATTNRHIKSCVIWSVHHYKILNPTIRENANLLILFPAISKEKLKNIFEDWNTHDLTFDEFYKIYMYCTKNDYNFMYINLDSLQMRKNFNELIINK
jgi:hypothetical protein